MADVNLYECPEYQAKKDDWTSLRDFYEGKKEVLIDPKYLVLHQIERAPNGGAQVRLIREQISEYTNYLAMVINHYLSLMFKSPADLSEVKDVFGPHYKNVDGDGSSVDTFIKDCIAKNLILYGRPLVRTDTYAIDATSAAAEEQLGQRPIWKLIDPLDAPDWYRSETKLRAFRHEYLQEEPRQSLIEKPKESRYSRVYTQSKNAVLVQIFKGDTESKVSRDSSRWELVEEKILPIPEIPIAGAWATRSWVYGVMCEQRRFWKLDSSLDNVVHYQSYDIRVATGITENSQKMALTEHTLFFLPTGATLDKLAPSYPQALIEKVEQSRQNIFTVAFNALRLPSAGSKESEGEGTLRERREDMITFIQSQIEVIETVANQAVSHWAMMSGQKPPTGKVKLSRKITLKDIDQMIAIFGALRDEMSRYPTWKKRTLKQIASAQGFDDDEEIESELDAEPQAQPVQNRPRLLDLINVGRPAQANDNAPGGAAR